MGVYNLTEKSIWLSRWIDVKICPILGWWKHSSLQPLQLASGLFFYKDIELYKLAFARDVSTYWLSFQWWSLAARKITRDPTRLRST